MLADEKEPLLHDDSTPEVRRCYALRSEFRCRNFGFSYLRKDAFYRSQWPMPSSVYIAYRLIVCAYMLAVLVWTSVSMPVIIRQPHMAYLTSWAFTALCVHLVLALLLTVYHTARGGCPRHAPRTPSQGSEHVSSSAGYEENEVVLVEPVVTTTWAMKLSWLAFSVIANSALIVSVVYFAAIYPGLHRNGTPISAEDFHLHAVNSMVILIDLLISSYPVRLLHVIYPAVFGLLYLLFSVIYWAIDHRNVLYPHVLDWNHPGMTLLVVFVLLFIGIPVVQLMLFGLYRLRVTLAIKFGC